MQTLRWFLTLLVNCWSHPRLTTCREHTGSVLWLPTVFGSVQDMKAHSLFGQLQLRYYGQDPSQRNRFWWTGTLTLQDSSQLVCGNMEIILDYYTGQPTSGWEKKDNSKWQPQDQSDPTISKQRLSVSLKTSRRHTQSWTPTAGFALEPRAGRPQPAFPSCCPACPVTPAQQQPAQTQTGCILSARDLPVFQRSSITRVLWVSLGALLCWHVAVVTVHMVTKTSGA